MGMGIAATAALVAIGAAVFIVSGVSNIGADDHHTKLVLAVIEELRERSIAARAATTGHMMRVKGWSHMQIHS
jgi:hypothetical protein